MPAFHLINRKAKRELKTYKIKKILPFCPDSIYLGVKLDGTHTNRHQLETPRKQLSAAISLLRRLAESGWVESAKKLCTAALSLVYSRTEYCSPVWCRIAQTLIVVNDTLHIVPGYFRPTPTKYLSVISGIQPAELCPKEATLFIAKRGCLHHIQL